MFLLKFVWKDWKDILTNQTEKSGSPVSLQIDKIKNSLYNRLDTVQEEIMKCMLVKIRKYRWNERKMQKCIYKIYEKNVISKRYVARFLE